MAEKITREDIEDVKTISILGTNFNIYGTLDKPLFLAADVAAMIEYSLDKTGQMLELVDEDEKLTDTIYRSGQQREVWFLTENGLYELLMQSRKPLAKVFKMEIKKVLHQVRMGELISQRVVVANNSITIDGTKFIFETNFAGDPKRDRFNSTQRRANLIIPSEEQAIALQNMGINVKETKPKPGEEEGFIPTYFVVIKLNYDSQRPPKVYLMVDHSDVLLNSETVCCIDSMWVDRVNVVLNIYDGQNGTSLYIKSMEVFQRLDDDPIASRHRLSE